MAEQIARDLAVHGRVQGVFFRAFVRDQSRRRGVRGRATNAADGTVRVHLEGEREAVAAVVGACAVGPDRARFDRVDERAGEVEGLEGFEVG